MENDFYSFSINLISYVNKINICSRKLISKNYKYLAPAKKIPKFIKPYTYPLAKCTRSKKFKPKHSINLIKLRKRLNNSAKFRIIPMLSDTMPIF
jgi:hypothetical protein